MKKRQNPRAWKEQTDARNELTRIRGEEERNYEKNITEKCKDEPKLLYKFINGKLNTESSIQSSEQEARCTRRTRNHTTVTLNFTKACLFVRHFLQH